MKVKNLLILKVGEILTTSCRSYFCKSEIAGYVTKIVYDKVEN